MRVAFQEQPRLDCPPVDAVPLNLNCRDEIIPILRALQHVYGDIGLRQEILDLIGNDVNADSSADQGRKGLDYWTIMVLAAVRLGCNLDYDKLQDLAEQHRTLRLIMGIGDWEDQTDFDWRRIRDNLCLLRPETIAKINQAIVAAGHKLVPDAIETVRGDTFVVETNIHYPTESSLIQDGLRKVAKLAADLATIHGQPGWRQHEHVLRNVKKIVRQINRLSRAKSQGADRLKPGYRKLLTLAEDLLQRARQLLAALAFCTEGAGIDWLGAGLTGPCEELWHYVLLTEKVCDTARRRVLLGETVPNEDKRQSHPGIESAVGGLQSGNGQERCRDKSKRGYDRYVGLGILGRNLHVLGKILLAQDDAKCEAAQSKRKAAG